MTGKGRNFVIEKGLPTIGAALSLTLFEVGVVDYTTPKSSIALATLRNPAILAPLT